MLTYISHKPEDAFTVTLDNVDMAATKLVIYKEGSWCGFTSDGVLYYTNKPVTICGAKAQVELKTGA